MKLNTLIRHALVAPVITLALTGAAAAQSYPAKPINIVVPYPPGGPTDIVARVIGQELSERVGQPVVIENKPGAGGNIGAAAVARAAPDGYTLLLGTTAHAINPSVFKSLDYDIIKDFTPVVRLTSLPLGVITHPSVPAKNIRELITVAKQKPLTYASSGNGQSTHLSAELFLSMADVKMTHVPYKGSAPALTDLVGGHVDVMFNTLLSSMPSVQAGKVNILAVTSAKRAGSAPDIPTIAESGLPGYEADAWSGVLAPAGTPSAAVERLNKEINAILETPEVKARLGKDGADLIGGTPEEFATHLNTEVKKWAAVAEKSGAKLD